MNVSDWAHPHPEQAPHPDAAEIIRQVEFYFSDENLPHDAHLLGLAGGDGNGPVNISQILNWNKMKRFKPPAAAKAALRQSMFLEFTDNKHIKRRYPLTAPITVTPKIDLERQKRADIQAKTPWLTKNMLKPTGFEEHASEGPVNPDEYEQDRRDYDPEESFEVRIERAINKYNRNRKMHQTTRAVFEKLMVFGGIDCGQRQFIGGNDQKQLKKEGCDAEEIAARTAYYGIAERVKDGIAEAEDGGRTTWVVDFEGLARAFLSSQFINFFNWYNEEVVKTATNVLRNFYNYLLLHDVCQEYKDQLLAAREVCSLAEEELINLCVIDRCLPGGFNTACSTLHEGSFAGVHRTVKSSDGWESVGGNVGLSDEEAKMIFRAGVAAYGTDEQYNKAEAAVNDKGTGFKAVAEEQLGLEVVRVEFADAEARAMYEHGHLANTYVHAMGKLHCKRWAVPFAPPSDLPLHATGVMADTFEFLVEDETLKLCYPGMKMEAVVKELDGGIRWIDRIDATFPSFFLWVQNERIREWKEGAAERVDGEADGGGKWRGRKAWRDDLRGR